MPKKVFLNWLKPLCIKVLKRFMVAAFVSFFYCEKRQKNTFKKALTYQLIEFSIRNIEKQQTKNPAITPVKKIMFVGKYTRRYENDFNIRIHGSDHITTI